MADELTIQGARLDLPEGWRRSAAGNSLQLTRSFPEAADGRGSGQATILIVGPAAEAASRFDANFDMIRAAVPELADEDPTTEADGLTTSGHRFRLDERCCFRREGVSFGQAVVGIGDRRRQIFLVMMTAGLRGDNRERAEAEFAEIVRSLRLNPGEDGFALITRAGDGGLDGVYTHLDSGLRINPLGGMDFVSESDIIVFDPKGLFAEELPTGGVTVSEFCAEKPEVCGLYAAKGNRITLRRVANAYGLLDSETLSLARDGADLLIDDASYRHLPPFAPDSRLDGTWSATWAMTGGGVGSSTSMASERSLTLRRDGRFERRGWFGATTSTEIGDSRSGVSVSGDRDVTRGRYRLDEYTLSLRSDDGTVEMLGIFAPDDGSDDLLVIDGANYLKD